MIGSLFLILGTSMFGVSTPSVPLYIPAFLFIGLGGPVLYFSSLHLMHAFPTRAGTIMTLLSVGYDASSAVYYLFRIAYEKSGGSVSVRQWFLWYNVIPVLAIIMGVTVMPRKALGQEAREKMSEVGNSVEFSRGSEAALKQEIHDQNESTKAGFPQNNEILELKDIRHRRAEEIIEVHGTRKDPNANEAVPSEPSISKNTFEQQSTVELRRTIALENRSIKDQLKSTEYILFALFNSLIVLQLNVYISEIYNQLLEIVPEEDAVTMSATFGWLLPVGGIASIPFVSYIVDHMRFSTLFGFTTLLTLLFTALAMIPTAGLQYATMTLVTITRALTWSANSTYISKTFGSRTFGVTYGMVLIITGLVGLLQYAMNVWGLSYLHGYRDMNAMMLGVVTIIGLFYVRCQRRYERRVYNQAGVQSWWRSASIHPGPGES